MDGATGSEGEPPELSLIGRMIGRYRVESRLGLPSGMGEVYLAHDTLLRCPRALKRIRPELRQDERCRRRFVAEAEKAMRVADPHVAAIVDVLDTPDDTFLVMEYVPGPTLRQRLGRSLEVPAFLDLAIACTEAVAATHENGILHRDVKPENFIVTPKGGVKLVDFGIAKELPPCSEETTRPLDDATTRSSLAGTLPYMSPEALLGQPLDCRADLFSLGVVFYEMLAGAHPFHGETPTVTSDRILHATPESLEVRVPGLPPRLADLVGRLLAKRPADRPPNAHVVLHDLIGLRDLEVEPTVRVTTPTAPDPGGGSPPGRWWRSRRAVAMAATGAIAVAAIAWVIVQPRPLPVEKRVLVRGLAPRDTLFETQFVALGTQNLIETALVRLTNVGAGVASGAGPGAASRSLPALQCVGSDSKMVAPNLVLSGWLWRDANRWRAHLQLADARDSTVVLRHADLEAPLRDGLQLAGKTIATAARLLGVPIAAGDVNLLWDPGTRVAGACFEDLRGRGRLAAELEVRTSPGTTHPPVRGLLLPHTENAVADATALRVALLDSAEAAFRRALALDPTDTRAWIGIARAAWNRRGLPGRQAAQQQAAEACQQALTLDLENADAHAQLGEIYAEMRRYPAAAAELERTLALNPTDDYSIDLLWPVYERLGRHQDSERVLQAAIEARPNYALWHGKYGYLCAGRARYEDAAKHYRRAIELAPAVANYYSTLGALYLLQGLYQSAIPYMQKAIDLEPTPHAYSNLGTTYFMMRRFAPADSIYRRAIERGCADCVVWGSLGDACYYDPGRRALAPDAYRHALELAEAQLVASPQDARMLGRAARYHAQLGNSSTAQSYLRRALVLAPRSQDLLYTAALVHLQGGATDSAFAYLGKALAAGYPSLWMQESPELDALRTDARYARLWER